MLLPGGVDKWMRDESDRYWTLPARVFAFPKNLCFPGDGRGSFNELECVHAA